MSSQRVEWDRQVTSLTTLVLHWLREACRQSLPDFPAEFEVFTTLEAFIKPLRLTHCITYLYHAVQAETVGVEELTGLRWSTALGIEVSEELWKKCCAMTGRLSPSSCYRIVHFKFLHQAYYMLVRLWEAGLLDTA